MSDHKDVDESHLLNVPSQRKMAFFKCNLRMQDKRAGVLVLKVQQPLAIKPFLASCASLQCYHVQ